MKQLTLEDSVTLEGINVYFGDTVKATFHPAREDSGIHFRYKNEWIKANLASASNERKGIALSHNGESVYLVEHLLSALYALKIDNANIELDGNVCPTFDNCALEYFDVLKDNIYPLSKDKRYWKCENEFEIRSPETQKPDRFKVIPSLSGSSLTYQAYYPHTLVGDQRFTYMFDSQIYRDQIAPARPPALFRNETLMELFLLLGRIPFGHGITPKNYLLIPSITAIEHHNPEEYGVRFSGEEFVRHKVLDVLGTLALTGRQFIDTEFEFNMTGHEFDIYALKELMESDSVVGY